MHCCRSLAKRRELLWDEFETRTRAQRIKDADKMINEMEVWRRDVTKLIKDESYPLSSDIMSVNQFIDFLTFKRDIARTARLQQAEHDAADDGTAVQMWINAATKKSRKKPAMEGAVDAHAANLRGGPRRRLAP